MTLTPHDIWHAWAPPDAFWSQWAKPVLIAQLGSLEAVPSAHLDWQSLDVSQLPRASDRTAIVIDLEGVAAVEYGLALAKRGFCPVPLFNGCAGRNAVVPNDRLQAALVDGGKALRELKVAAEAPPAFLLDARRLAKGGRAKPGEFDNRWMTFPQDFPSAALLTSHGIETVVLLQDETDVGEDLAHVLYRWRESGMRIVLQCRTGQAKEVPLTLLRPSGYRALWHRALAALGFRRNSAGGFGSLIPEPAPHSGSGRIGFG